jgi:hypothetical protein
MSNLRFQHSIGVVFVSVQRDTSDQAQVEVGIRVWRLAVKNAKNEFHSSRVILIQVDRHQSSVGKFSSLCHVTIEEAIEISRSETENDRGNEEAPFRVVMGVRYY